ncbi:MAG: benzoate/H(+) symporter BenE family transporter [Anaerolineae bacterium]|jgi:benzoate membrane transport protein|nr:benzoate/H(+) symporter BenE family transporter [Anaerolineae bacterium]
MSQAPQIVGHTPATLASFMQNLRDLPRSISISGITAGFIIALISYTGPILIILQAAEATNFTPEQTASWVWAIVIGNGVGSILLSLLYRQPLITPHNTAGSALLVTSLTQFPLSDAIGAYIITALAVVLLGLSGWFGRAMRAIPQSVVSAVLAGVLLRFGLGIFNAIDDAPLNPLMIGAMVAAFFLLKRAKFRAPTLGAMLIGTVIAGTTGQMQLGAVDLTLTLPVFTAPTFSPDAILALSLPLFALALSSQYAPGEAVLRANHYDPPINSILTITGLMSVVLAFFGGHGTCLGALTAAIVVSPDAQPDPTKRYASAVASGVWHVGLGLMGAAVVSLFAAFPAVFISTIAGLSLSGIIANALAGAMADPNGRDAAIVAFLCTAGDFSLLGIGAPFWGLVAGFAVHLLMTAYRRPVEA